MAVRRALHRRGLRYRVGVRVLPDTRRTVDVIFARARVALFIDGCYWHGCADHGTAHRSKSNQTFWQSKIAQNQARDGDTDRRLRQAGWTVVRAWEHEDPEQVADRVEAAVRIAGPSSDL